MKTPIYDAICKYKDEKARFHMPGHSGTGEGILFSQSSFDITELSFSDNLLNSDGIIREAENLAAKDYKAERTLFVTQGTTIGLQIAVGIVSRLKGRIATLGEMHRSFWNATRLFGLDVCVYSSVDSLKQGMEREKISAIFVMSPNYFGETIDFSNIEKILKHKKVLLIVDGAHMAHYPFSSLLPRLPKCDIITCSMHKTMGVYGGGAIVNIYNKELIESAEYFRSLLHSTSPSYMIMASMDYARAKWEEEGDEYYKQIQSKVSSIKSVGDFVRLENDDFSRLVFVNNGYDVSIAAEALEKKGFYIEGAYRDRLILIVTPYNLKYIDNFVEALKSIKGLNYIKLEKARPLTDRYVESIKDVEVVEIEESLGRIVAQEICLYPPATPILYCGEVISSNIISFIKENRLRLFGLASGKVLVVK